MSEPSPPHPPTLALPLLTRLARSSPGSLALAGTSFTRRFLPSQHDEETLAQAGRTACSTSSHHLSLNSHRTQPHSPSAVAHWHWIGKYAHTRTRPRERSLIRVFFSYPNQ